MERYSALLIKREKQIKTTPKIHFLPIKLEKKRS